MFCIGRRAILKKKVQNLTRYFWFVRKHSGSPLISLGLDSNGRRCSAATGPDEVLFTSIMFLFDHILMIMALRADTLMLP